VQVYEQMEPPAEMLMSLLPFHLVCACVQVYEQMEPPAEMLMSLLPFQKEFLAWAISQERSEIRGGILADEMGMGKTIQVLPCTMVIPHSTTCAKYPCIMVIPYSTTGTNYPQRFTAIVQQPRGRCGSIAI